MYHRHDSLQLHRFTLLEVLIAVVILGLSLGAVMTITATAKRDFIRARERWGKQHSVEQATEFFLLTRPGDWALPDGLLPPGYVANCQLVPAEDLPLPEHALAPERGWTLAAYRISVFDDQGRQLGEAVIHKLLREEDLQ